MRWKLPFSPWHLLLMPLALIFVLPLVQMVLTSFMSSAEINQFPPKLIPSSFHIEGYRHLFSETKALRWFLNTVIVSGIAVVSHLVLCSMAGYGFARLKFAGRGLAFVLILATVMIPIQLLMIPTYLMFARIGIVDTLAAAFVPGSSRLATTSRDRPRPHGRRCRSPASACSTSPRSGRGRSPRPGSARSAPK